MGIILHITNSMLEVKSRLVAKNLDSLLWIVDFIPRKAGFSIFKNRSDVLFWILHWTLLLYVYGVGCIVYQVHFAQGARDFIKSYVSISILVLTANNSYWFLMKRPLLRCVLEKVKEVDTLTRDSQNMRQKHEKLLTQIKYIVFIFYGFNCTDGFFIYIPARIDVSGEQLFSLSPCCGMEPLTVSPNREICMMILGLQELTIMTVVLNYQALVIVLIAHTAAMYQVLSEEMCVLDLETKSESQAVKERLTILIGRHVLILDIIKKLKDLYSMPIGVNFGSNAICICFFFFLPLQEWIPFMPILVYCFLVFFLYCFQCQRLINASEMFERAVYSCGWENFESKDMKSVYIILLQAQKPITLLAADIIPVNIYTFASTLQTMYKFVTVVKV